MERLNFTKKQDRPLDQPAQQDEYPAPGWDVISAAFQRLYPGQDNPLHFGTLIPWQLGGENPLDGISVYDGGAYYHFVTYGLSELYEKESENQEYSGYGFEFTLKLSKAGLEDVDGEIQCICGILQALARLTFEHGEIFQPNEYIYTGQKMGMDLGQKSKLTGFITALDEAGEIDTPNGKVQFVKLIGVTDKELQGILDKRVTVWELSAMLDSGWTDYTRESVIG